MNQRITKLTFFAFVVLAFSLRIIYFNQTSSFIRPGIGSDSYFYLQWARDIIRGNILGQDLFYALPLYPYFLSLAYGFSGGDIFDLMLIQMFIGAFNCGLVYLLGKKLFNHQVGIVAAIIACGYTLLIFYDRMLSPVSLSIFLGLILALSLLKVKDNPGLSGWLMAGLLLGLCSLVRASFLLLFFFLLVWIIFEYKREPLKKLLLYCLYFALPVILIIGAVNLRNYLVSKDVVFLTAHSGINFYIGNNPQADGLFKTPAYMRQTQGGLIEDARIVAEQVSGRRLRASEVSGFWFGRSLDFIKSQPLNYLRLLGRKFALFWNAKEHVDDIEYYLFKDQTNFLERLPLFRFSLICPLAFLGIFLSKSEAKKAMPIYLFIIAFSLATILFFVNSRYRLDIIPYLIIFAAFSLWRLVRICRQRQYQKLIFSLAVFLGLYFLVNIKFAQGRSALNYTLYYNKGIYFTGQGDYVNAQKEFQTALKINPYDFLSFFGLGNVYAKMQDSSSAEKNYKITLAINPLFYKAYFNLGLIYKQQKRYKQAQEQFKQVLRLKPDDCDAHYNLGELYQKQGKKQQAQEEYQKALQIEPNHPEVLEAIKGMQ